VKFKLDENPGRRCAARLQDAGHEVSTVLLQGLSGAPDETIFRVCAQEERVLITLDFDFAQPLRFPPERSAGVVILSAPGPMTSGLLSLLMDQFIAMLPAQPLRGRLWIVEPGRIRIHAADRE
jgi:predicted nuclease of predicted toxin-antitoxin system